MGDQRYLSGLSLKRSFDEHETKDGLEGYRSRRYVRIRPERPSSGMHMVKTAIPIDRSRTSFRETVQFKSVDRLALRFAGISYVKAVPVARPKQFFCLDAVVVRLLRLEPDSRLLHVEDCGLELGAWPSDCGSLSLHRAAAREFGASERIVEESVQQLDTRLEAFTERTRHLAGETLVE
jgi:hypothetical protein